MTSEPGELIPWISPLTNEALPIDPWAANPLVDAYQRLKPELVAMADAEGARPTFFNTGDLPAFTASGLDPRTLQDIPWQARHATAQMASVAEVFAVVQQYSRDADVHLESDGLTDYLERIADWIRGNPSAVRGPAAAVPESQQTIEDALYESMFGAYEAGDKAKNAAKAQAAADLRRQQLKLGYYVNEQGQRVYSGGQK